MKLRKIEIYILVAMAVIVCVSLAMVGGTLLYFGGRQTTAEKAVVVTVLAVVTPTTDAAALHLASTLEPTRTPLPTSTPFPTVPMPTNTPGPSSTPKPTETPRPSSTPLPPTKTSTPEYEIVNNTQKIGPMLDTANDESYTLEITLKGVKWSVGDKYSSPKSGNVYVVAYLRIKNLGPSAARSISSMDFQILDANGALMGDSWGAPTKDCALRLSDLISGGSTEGCIGFEAPMLGKLDLVYAPYRYEGLKPGRYLNFNLRKK